MYLTYFMPLKASLVQSSKKKQFASGHCRVGCGISSPSAELSLKWHSKLCPFQGAVVQLKMGGLHCNLLARPTSHTWPCLFTPNHHASIALNSKESMLGQQLLLYKHPVHYMPPITVLHISPSSISNTTPNTGGMWQHQFAGDQQLPYVALPGRSNYLFPPRALLQCCDHWGRGHNMGGPGTA